MQLLVAMPSGHRESHGSAYSNEPWIGLGNYSQPSQQIQNDYPSYDYQASVSMSMESSYAMNRPPPYATPQHAQMPPPLVMPQHNVWPSMLATSTAYQQPILPAVPVHTPLSATSVGSDLTPTSAKTATSRRKLTDEERRLMCLEAENNPSMKQTQIGAKFNVERSTVSKILRQKDKYMKPQAKEEVVSPGKKPKVKLPDVEKTLSVWYRNQQKKGQPVTIEDLRKQVLMFTSGRTDQHSYTSTAWLQKFLAKLSESRSGSREDTIETSTSLSETIENSPTSSNGLVSPSMSAIEDNQAFYRASRTSHGMFDFEGREYEHSPSLPHGFASDAGYSSEVLLSPISPEVKHDYVSSVRIEDASTDTNLPRQRSMTLPHLAAAPPNPQATSDRPIPPLPVRSTTSINEHRNGSIDPRQMMKRHKSVPDIHDTEVVRYSSMQPPPIPRSADISPISMPSSPSQQDDTIKALDNIKKLLEQRPDVAEPDDYVMIGKLMEKLKLLRNSSGTTLLPGGMHPIDTADSPRLSKKRTQVEMSM